MFIMNDKWKKSKDLGPLEYYLHDLGEYDGGVLENAKILPPFSNDKILNIVKKNWLHLTDNNREIYIYDGVDTIGKHDYDGDYTIFTYNPLLCFCNYYEYENLETDEPKEINKFIVFIKKLTWKETQSEGCGWADYECPCEIYLARNLEDIVKYAITRDENYFFDQIF